MLPLQGASALASADRSAGSQHVLPETPAQPSLPYWRAVTAMPRKRHSEDAPSDLLRCAVSLAQRYAGRTVFVSTPCQDNFA